MGGKEVNAEFSEASQEKKSLDSIVVEDVAWNRGMKKMKLLKKIKRMGRNLIKCNLLHLQK